MIDTNEVNANDAQELVFNQTRRQFWKLQEHQTDVTFSMTVWLLVKPNSDCAVGC